MTGQLRSTLTEQADRAPLAPVDTDTVQALGRRRVRRRMIGATGGVAMVVAAAIGLVLLVPHPGRQADPVTGTSLPLDTTVYAVGSSLHLGSRTVDLGRRVDALVQTRSGVVYTSGRTVWAWQDGVQQRVGSVAAAVPDGYLLKVDQAGEQVAWVDTRQGPRLAVLTASTEQVRRGPRLTGKESSVRAVSDGVAYLATAGRLDAVDTSTLRTEKSYPGVAVARVLDVRAGWYLTATAADDESRQGAVLSRTPLGRGQFFDQVWIAGTLSPQARRLVSEDIDDDTTVLDVGSGERTDVRHPGFYFASGYRWLDDDRFLAAAIRREGQTTFSLLTCSVARARCRIVAPDIGPIERVALPFGLDITD